MSRYYSYLNTAKEIINSYSGGEPLHAFLRKKFAAGKKYGSADRKQIGHLCYCFFRLGKMGLDHSVEERILAGLFLCSDQPNELLQQLKPEWSEKAASTINEKMSLLNSSYVITAIFPWQEEMTANVEHEDFCRSFFIQPLLFLRLRPGKEKMVTSKLDQANVPFKTISASCLALPNTTQLESIIAADREAVIQDYSSQKTGELLDTLPVNNGSPFTVWDCCAASGGKSIMLKDRLQQMELTVSDVRASILINLRKRFERAGITRYKSMVADLSHFPGKINTGLFDLVLADIPCSGSGTWGRTPEQLYYFDQKQIASYAALQKKILANVIPHIKAGGYLLYITCSVFRQENEEAVNFMKQEFRLNPVQVNLLKGYDKRADTLFAALLKKEL